MKVISIGRNSNCNIVLDDSTVSRRHAMLKVYASGKMEIVDLSTNGTFVDNNRIKSNIPYRITRKNVVRFAENQLLDWSEVPNPIARYVKIFIVVAGLVVAGIVANLLISGRDAKPDDPAPVGTEETINGNGSENKADVLPEKKDTTGVDMDKVIQKMQNREKDKVRESEKAAKKAAEEKKAKEEQRKKEMEKKQQEEVGNNNIIM